jgi:hypothetical protein
MRERHPIQDSPDLPIEQRVQLLECYLAQLWDEVWWHRLPWYRRFWYWLPRIERDRTHGGFRFWKGHRSPIKQFYY